MAMDDGQMLDVWYFGDGFNSDRKAPSPVIEAIEGQTVEVTLSAPLITLPLNGMQQLYTGRPSYAYSCLSCQAGFVR